MKMQIDYFNNLTLKLYPLDFNPQKLNGMSEETIMYHYEKHHQNYINKSLELLKNSQNGSFNENITLIHLLKTIPVYSENSTKEENLLYFNIAQVFNHHLFWLSIQNNSMSENEINYIKKHFYSYENFKKEFINEGLNRFGSGWIWLLEIEGYCKIITSQNGHIPKEVFNNNVFIISVCDVWEHAYYIDYRHERKKFLENFIDNIMKLNI
jgi:Fe-Mn family superoxide dismutase